uniref:Retrovirus-related Pol polyprotein from transposon TNT 1-94 n=1 Tax=Tanacetum cinerariifolium TaxID=118510 RepID=A0A6L2MPL7_TANCI|nr:retrovirus-related Pol polyprotein from transposon TNT 1-94 [Tanacetum cinerariifolium]
MTLETHNWSSSAHQELHKIVKDEIFPIVNQVDASVQNFEIQFLKEASKFVGDFKSLTKEADESLAKHKALELEIKRLLRAVVSHDIMFIVQNNSVFDTSNLQTELEHKAYKDMQQKIERLQAQLGDLMGKSKDTSGVTDTLNPLSQTLENENVELEFQVLNYAKENVHLKATYKNMFESIFVSRTQTKTIIVSLQNKLQNTIYENAKLRAQLFNKVGETHALSKPVTSNSVPTPQESKVVKNHKVIAPGMFRINPFKTSREEKHVPNNVKASARKKPINVSQHPVITKKDVNSDSNGLSFTGIDNTKTRRPQPRSNTKNDRVPSTSKSSRSKNKGPKVKKHHRNLLLSKNTKHMSSACNNIKLDSQNVISKVVCTMCLPKFKYHKEHLCPSCEQGKSKRASHPPKPVPNSRQRLHLIHMDLCGPTTIASINGKRYVLVIVEDYSRYTWVYFLRSKDEAPKVMKTFLKRIIVLLQSPVIIIRTDKGTKFKNQVLKEYFDTVGISHQISSVRTMLIFSRASLFLWAEAIASACFTQNRSIIHRRFNKTPYELINGRKLDISFLYVFEALCYPKNDREDIAKLGAKGDIVFFIGYSADSCAYRIYNRRTKKIMLTMNVSFDELSAMDFEQSSSKPELQSTDFRPLSMGIPSFMIQ